MHVPRWVSGIAAASVLGLFAGPLGVAHAAPTATPTVTPSADASATPSATPTSTPTASATATRSAQPGATAVPTVDPKAAQCSPNTLTLLNFNDFHGRIPVKNFFGTLEAERTAAGDANSLVLSAGDNIGGSTFESGSQADNPTIDIMNKLGLNASAVGNHEFDQGYADLRKRIDGGDASRVQAQFPYLGANVYQKGTQTPALKEYEIFEKAGVKVAVIGAVTQETTSLVSPDGISGLDFGDPVDAVNRVAKQLTDGDPANGEADVIVAEYHNGAAGSGTLATETAASAAYKKIVEQTDSHVAAIFTAHTHQTYVHNGAMPNGNGTRPVIQAASYAEKIGKVQLSVDKDTKDVSCYSAEILTPRAVAPSAPINDAIDAAVRQADVVGSQVIGSAGRALTHTTGGRNEESALNNMVAQMFKDQLGQNNANFIGVQNPGGTRTNIDAGDITYKEAALVLPFANSLMTTELTGAQVKQMLEQQWQPAGTSRPFLSLGLSNNVTYTYDESRAAGDRITAIYVAGKPIDPAVKYTVGSGSFLIAGGDNFTVVGQGTNRKDSGRVDLEAWVDWIRTNSSPTAIQPDEVRRGVSVSPQTTALTPGTATEVKVGVPVTGAPAATNTKLDVYQGTPNTQLVARLCAPGTESTCAANGPQIGTATVTNGQATIGLTAPADYTAKTGTVMLVASPTNTVAAFAVTVGDQTQEPTLNFPVNGAIGAKFYATGGLKGPLGQPLDNEHDGLVNGGWYQIFEGGVVTWAPGVPASITKNAMRDKWMSMGGENSRLGYPTTDEICGLKDGGCYQTFQGGYLVWSPATGTHVSWGGIRQVWADNGVENGRLGYPTTDEIALANGGFKQDYQGGSIYWSPATGGHTVWGGIGDYWKARGAETSVYGYPTTSEMCGDANGVAQCVQYFQKGSISWNARIGIF